MKQIAWLLGVTVMILLEPASSWSDDKPVASVETLVKQLEHSAADRRIEAAEALGKLGVPGPAAVEKLTKMLTDADPDVRAAGAKVLGTMGAPAKSAAPALLALFKDEAPTSSGEPVWYVAGTAYGKLAPDSLPLLLKELKSENRTVFHAAAVAIHHIGPEAKGAVPTLVELLQKNNPETRIAIIYALMGLGPDAAAAVPALIEMTRNDDFHTQYWSCRALGKVGLPGAKVAVPVLLKLLSDEIASVRGNAAAALGNLGPGAGPEVVPALTKSLKDKLYNVRTAAAIALGQMGPLAIDAVPQLDASLANESFAARSQAAIARWQITREVEPTVRVLVAELENPNSPWDAASGFQQIGPPAAVAVDRLIKLLGSPDRETRIWTASALAGIGASAKRSVPKLTEMLQDKEEEIREVAAETIRVIENAEK